MLQPLSSICALSGRQTITAMDFRRHPGEVFLQASLGRTFVVTKSGRPWCLITPYEPDASELGAAVRALGLAGG